MVDSIYRLPPALAVLTPHMRDRVAKRSWGPMLWKQLHDRPEQTGGDLSGELEWIEGFRQAIICEECQAHFSYYLLQHPPDLSSVHAYFFWTWYSHNVVRRKQGKDIYKWKRSEWGDPPHPVPDHAIE